MSVDRAEEGDEDEDGQRTPRASSRARIAAGGQFILLNLLYTLPVLIHTLQNLRRFDMSPVRVHDESVIELLIPDQERRILVAVTASSSVPMALKPQLSD